MSLQAYRELQARFEQKQTELCDLRWELEAQLTEARRDYNRAMVADLDLDAGNATHDFARAGQEVQRIEYELRLIEERIDALQTVKKERLREAFEDVVTERDRIVDGVTAEYLEAAEDLKKWRAEVLLKLQQLHDIGRKATDAHHEVKNEARLLGVEYRGWLHLPALNLTSQHAGIDAHLLPTESEMNDALHFGKIPAFAEHYRQTGHIIGNRDAELLLEQQVNEGKQK